LSVKVWVGRFAIVGGQPQEEGPLLRSFPRQRPDEEEDELYVLVDPTTEASRQYCAQLVDAVGHAYQQDTLSITGAALRALRAAHRQLFDWNQRTLRDQRVSAGIACLAVRDRTAYLSLTGPSVAYYVGGGRFRRIAPEGTGTVALGISEWAEPAFDRYELAPGDLLLIASPQIEELLNDDALRTMLMKGGDEALVELFRMAKDQQEFALVLLACVVEPEGGTVAPAPVAAPEPLSRSAPAIAEQVIAAEPPTAPAAPPPALEEDIEAPSPPQRPRSDPRQPLPEPMSGYSQPKVRLKGTEAGVTYRRPTGIGAALPRIPPLAMVAAIVVVIVGLLAWYIVPQALQQSKTDKFNSLVHAAQSDLSQAMGTQDIAQKRALLASAKTALDDAERQIPNQPEVATLRSQVQTELNKLNAILLLPDLELITDVSGRLPGPVSPRDLALGGGGAYFLDRQSGRVIAVSLLGGANPEPIPIFEAGNLIGDQITGKATAMGWSEGLASLLVLDESRRLIAVTPGGAARLLTVRAADTWGSADGIAYAGSDLYVMDRKDNQVWRYPPSQDGFDSEREGVLSGFDLSQAVEMAVADGLYFLMQDNRIVHIGSAGTQTSSQAGIDTPLSSPGSLLPLPDLHVVILADRGNGRIVEFDPDGSFKQQLASARFTDLRSVAVDVPNQLLYILVGGALYRTPLPPLP
jgi:hypothetical protein